MRLHPLHGSAPSPHLSHLQRNLEAELLGVVTEDTPRGVEEDEGDPGLGPHDLLLQTQQVEVMSFSAAYPPPNTLHLLLVTFSCSSPDWLSFFRNFSLHFLWAGLTPTPSSSALRGSSHASTKSDHFNCI